jgi:hypothetical protein
MNAHCPNQQRQAGGDRKEQSDEEKDRRAVLCLKHQRKRTKQKTKEETMQETTYNKQRAEKCRGSEQSD